MIKRVKKSISLLLCMLFSLTLLVGPALAAKPTPTFGTLAGTVTIQGTGTAIAGAMITATGKAGAFQTNSDQNGAYNLSLPTGTYTVACETPNYNASSTESSIIANETTTLNFTLTPIEEPITEPVPDPEPTTPQIVTYTADHVFSINDVQADANKTADSFGTGCLDLANPSIDAKDGLTYYGVDSAFGYTVADYEGAVEKPRDGIYDDGLVANVYDANGNVIGLKAKTVAPAEWLVSTPLTGEWNIDINGVKTKTSTEHYLTMDHWLNVPGAPPLEYGIDYRARFKDDGKKLYMWGNLNSEPTDLRFYTKMPLPEAWKVDGTDYNVTSAKLVVTHQLASSPNDQLRPEDLENENATGILPQYNVQPDGSWSAAVDSIHGDDGDACPAGTVLKLAEPLSIPNVDENGVPLTDYWGNPVLTPDVVSLTGDWYTTMDRDPFAGDSPRWRLKAATFGQDLSAVKIPWYTAGQYTTTTIDLLAPMNDEVTGALIPSALTSSTGWFDYMDDSDGVIDGYSLEGIPMTKDFDLAYYIKGSLSGQVVYNAKLIIEYEDPNATTETPVTTNDIAISGLNVPARIPMNSSANVSVSVKNNVNAEATGSVSLIGTDLRGNMYTFAAPFTVPADGSATTLTFNWLTPAYTTTVNWTATVTTDSDSDLSNNTGSGVTKVTR